MSYPIILCEDQLIQLNQLDTIIKNFILFHNDLFQVVLKSQSPFEVLDYMKKFEPRQGIYFLDIDLNAQINGIQLAEAIRKKDVLAKIIFVTTHDEMMPITIKKRIEALGFVEKTPDLEKYRAEIVELLLLAQERIDSIKNEQHQSFTFSVGSQVFTLDLNEVYFIESSDLPHRVILFSKNGEYEFYKKLSELEKNYPTLCRVNRSCLANLKTAKEIDFKSRKIYFDFDMDLVRYFSIGKANKIKDFIKNKNNITEEDSPESG